MSNLSAIELRDICPNAGGCTISTSESLITNHGDFTTKIEFSNNAIVDLFINYGNLASGFNFGGGSIKMLTNYGTISGSIRAYNDTNTYITNYGVMGGVQGGSITIDNRGVVNALPQGTHHFYSTILTIKNYAMIITEDANTFNNPVGLLDNSHLAVHGDVSFADSNAKMILDFGNKSVGNIILDAFEFGKEYSLDKLIINPGLSSTNVDFSRLTTRSELYILTQSGNNFVVNIADSKTAGYSMVGMLHKSNIKTMNDFFLQSNNVIYNKKQTKRKRTLQRRVIRKKVSNLFNDSIESPLIRHSELSLESEESMNLNKGLDSSLRALHYAQNDRFFYKSDSSDYYANNATTNPNSTNQNNANQTTTRRRITTQNRAISNQNDKYYFVLTPFVAHNYFYEAGRYNLSGLEYGFITAFSGKITPSNALGAHFAFSYGSLSDKNDKVFNITSSNIMAGLNYKFNMIWNMYLKARIDAFYFLNQVQSTMTSGNIMKPNNLGFGASIAYGKEWDFDKNGILGLEVALDYKGLMSPTIITQNNGDSTINESFNKALYNMLYVDLGLNYDKYFESSVGKWGLDTGLGVKVNATANALAKSTITLNNIRDINMTLDNDMFLAYLNLGGSYLLEKKDFDMEFSLAYYGNFGDRTMSNAGGFEWRVYW